MSTSLPDVTVKATKHGFVITCSCGHRDTRPNRYEADQHATSHRRVHAGGEAA